MKTILTLVVHKFVEPRTYSAYNGSYMLSLKNWLQLIILPLLTTWSVDRLTKNWALGIIIPVDWGPVLMVLTRNRGMMLGTSQGSPEILRFAAIAGFGAFSLFAFYVVQYFFPIRSARFRVGLSIFMGGVLGNVTDRIMYGYVIDFVQITTGPFRTGVFNIADALQWVGVALVLFELFTKGSILWPPEERRGRLWIKPEFQWRYCVNFLSVSLAGILIFGALAYTYLRIVLQSSGAHDWVQQKNLLYMFLVLHALIAGTFIISVAIVARKLSHRIAGPVQAFENFLFSLAAGRQQRLTLRNQDEFAHLEGVAVQFQAQIMEKLGIPPEPLQAGQSAPIFQATTIQAGDFDLNAYRGRKVWLCIYRYATCPLCADHLSEVIRRYDSLLQSNVYPVAVFDSAASSFFKPETGETCELLQSAPVPMIPDPEGRIYRLFRSRIRLWAVFHPKVILAFLRAKRKGFLQGSIDGPLGRIPVHVLISEDGGIHAVHYGKTIADHIPWQEVEKFAQLKTAVNLPKILAP